MNSSLNIILLLSHLSAASAGVHALLLPCFVISVHLRYMQKCWTCQVVSLESYGYFGMNDNFQVLVMKKGIR